MSVLRKDALHLYRALLRELNVSAVPQSPLSDELMKLSRLQPPSNNGPKFRQWLRTHFEKRLPPDSSVVDELNKGKDVLVFWRSQRTYKVLLERYNPTAGMEVEDKIRLSLRRVGLELPKSIKHRLKNLPPFEGDNDMSWLWKYTQFSSPVLSNLIPTVGSAFAIQAAFAIPSIISQSERVYDLSGSLTYIACTGLSLYLPALRARGLAAAQGLPLPPFPSILKGDFPARNLILSAMVLVWAGRLGSFLFQRVLKEGEDSRFNGIRDSPPKFFGAFMVQATWVSIMAFPIWILNAIPKSSLPGLTVFDAIGMSLWAAGLAFEATADKQKSMWREEKQARKHDEEFISSGLWSHSRHPNYFGEIALWTGNAVVSAATLTHVASSLIAPWVPATPLISPLFITFLLTKVSGVPMLEKKMDNKGSAKWKEYKARTPAVVPKLTK